jgi:hypothetical protein
LIVSLISVNTICINQGDPLERAAQVTIMSDIYKAAQNVIVWLGKRDEFTEDALTAIKQLSLIPKQQYPEVKLSNWYDQVSVLRNLGVWQEFSPHTWLGLVALLNRPWFKRAWAAQEVILAQNAMVVCGREVFPWTMLSDAYPSY